MIRINQFRRNVASLVFDGSWIASFTLLLLCVMHSAEAQEVRPTGGRSFRNDARSDQFVSHQLGISGHFTPAKGVVVDRVHYGTPAWRLNLEPGCTLCGVNGKPLHSRADYTASMRNSPHRVTLSVQEKDSERIVQRKVLLAAPYDSREVDAFWYGKNLP